MHRSSPQRDKYEGVGELAVIFQENRGIGAGANQHIQVGSHTGQETEQAGSRGVPALAAVACGKTAPSAPWVRGSIRLDFRFSNQCLYICITPANI